MHHVRAWAHSSAHESRFNPWSQDSTVATHAGVPPPATNNDAGGEPDQDKPKKPLFRQFIETTKLILFRSWMNALLVCVPAGIALHFAGVDPNAVFAVNAIAVVPLAGLLTFATECVAHRLGPTLGALMNVSFGNAVELIIFIIALVKNEIRVVQAALIGSILANLLLILGMAFLVGGLQYREQVYDSLVTQMSASLLALAVLSLLIPTAFHASFSNLKEADARVLKLSRGTSVILLITYLVYLLFQLKSHSYLYQGTPQHIIDKNTEPGVLQRMNSSSSSSSGSASTLSHSTGSHRRVDKRLKARVLGRKRKAQIEIQEPTLTGETSEEPEAITKEKEKERPSTATSKQKAFTDPPTQKPTAPTPVSGKPTRPGLGAKALSIRPPPVFRSPSHPPMDRPQDRIRRFQSAPNRASLWIDADDNQVRPPRRINSDGSTHSQPEEPPISQFTSIVLLLISTGLVALCAEFLVGSIEHLVQSSSVSEAFIGLIVLPIVGNAAEHVTAVTVAAKNKLDLSLGVSLGSSIQIALFVTPLVVIIGWIMDKEMSLYFNLFETVTIFVSTFVVNFLVLDGRSNYLEGFLLMISYVIIAVGAYLFPDSENQLASTRGPGG